MKRTALMAFALCAVTPLFAARIAQQPTFVNGIIMMSANGGLCGGLTIDPIIEGDRSADVRLRAYRFSESLFGTVKPGKPLSNWIELPVEGLRVGYDWAGPRPSFHYRIYCTKRNQLGHWELVDCQKAVKIRDVQHNKPCVKGPAGANASYEPLKMRVNKKR